MIPMTAEKLAVAVGCDEHLAGKWLAPLVAACEEYDITTAPRVSAFLAQIGHESAGLSRLVENLNYSASGLLRTWPSRFTAASAAMYAKQPRLIANLVYGGRLGNKEPDDGWRYRGRGLIMTTGRANYEAATELLLEQLSPSPDFAINPELLESPEWAAYSAAAYWSDHDLNPLADSGEFDRITSRINGGQIGKADRRTRYNRARQALA